LIFVFKIITGLHKKRSYPEVKSLPLTAPNYFCNGKLLGCKTARRGFNELYGIKKTLSNMRVESLLNPLHPHSAVFYYSGVFSGGSILYFYQNHQENVEKYRQNRYT